MTFTKEGFLKHVDVINEKNYQYANEILYRMCQGMEIFPHASASEEELGRFAGAILLIGRSYAASPERGSGTQGGDGLGDFFAELAETIARDKDYPAFREALQALSHRRYSFREEDWEADRLLVLQSASCVARFNDLIKSATVAQKRDVISFASKFLHFVVPHVFFIKDTYSTNGGNFLWNGNKSDVFFKDRAIAPADWIAIDATARTYFATRYPMPEEQELLGQIHDLGIYDTEAKPSKMALSDLNKRQYLLHALRAYLVARFLHDHGKRCAEQIRGDADSAYLPRLVDSVLMRIKE